MSTNYTTDTTDIDRRPYALSKERRPSQPIHDLLWWMTLEEFDRFVDGDLSLREIGEIVVARADESGGTITPALRHDEWYEEYQKTRRTQQ